MKLRKLLSGLLIVTSTAFVPLDNSTYTKDGTTDGSPTVYINDGAFTPQNYWVVPEATVTWINNDDKFHTVTSDDAEFNGEVSPGGSFNHTFFAGGPHPYHCSYHSGETGSIHVVVK